MLGNGLCERLTPGTNQLPMNKFIYFINHFMTLLLLKGAIFLKTQTLEEVYESLIMTNCYFREDSLVTKVMLLEHVMIYHIASELNRTILS